MLSYKSTGFKTLAKRQEKKTNAEMEREMRGGKDFYDETRTDISPEARAQIRKLKDRGIVPSAHNPVKRKRRTQHLEMDLTKDKKETKSIEPKRGFIERMMDKYKGKKKE